MARRPPLQSPRDEGARGQRTPALPHHGLNPCRSSTRPRTHRPGVEPATPVGPPDRAGREPGSGGRGGAGRRVALLPIVVVLIQRWGRVYVPVGDQAILDLRIRDVWSFSSDTPLTGPYSRFGWNHPGPAMYYLLALFSAGGPSAGLGLPGRQRPPASVAVAWIARLSWRTGGLRWMVPWLAVVTLSYWATGPWIFQQLWNPYLPFPFFTLLLLQAWVVGSGRAGGWWAWPSSAPSWSRPTWATRCPCWPSRVWAVVAPPPGRAPGRPKAPAVVAVVAPTVVLAVMWFVPLVVDTAVHYPGNTVRLVQFYLGLDGAPHLPSSGSTRPSATWPPSSAGGRPGSAAPTRPTASPRSRRLRRSPTWWSRWP